MLAYGKCPINHQHHDHETRMRTDSQSTPILSFKFFIFIYFGCPGKLVGSQSPGQGLNPCPWQQKLRVPTTTPPGNPLLFFIFMREQFSLPGTSMLMCLDNSRTHLLETFLCKAFPVLPMLFLPLSGFLHQSSLPVTLFAQSLLLCWTQDSLGQDSWVGICVSSTLDSTSHLFETVETMNEGIENLKSSPNFLDHRQQYEIHFMLQSGDVHTQCETSLFPVSLYTMHSDDFSCFLISPYQFNFLTFSLWAKEFISELIVLG